MKKLFTLLILGALLAGCDSKSGDSNDFTLYSGYEFRGGIVPSINILGDEYYIHDYYVGLDKKDVAIYYEARQVNPSGKAPYKFILGYKSSYTYHNDKLFIKKEGEVVIFDKYDSSSTNNPESISDYMTNRADTLAALVYTNIGDVLTFEENDTHSEGKLRKMSDANIIK